MKIQSNPIAAGLVSGGAAAPSDRAAARSAATSSRRPAGPAARLDLTPLPSQASHTAHARHAVAVSPDVREALVAQVRAQLANGYVVDPEKLARAILGVPSPSQD